VCLRPQGSGSAGGGSLKARGGGKSFPSGAPVVVVTLFGGC
jgi:hypothetical protein